MEGEVFFTLFNKYIKFISDDLADLGYIEKCASSLIELNSEVIDALCQSSLRYRNDCLQLTGERARAFSDVKEVLSLITPLTLFIPRPFKADEPVIHLELKCDWGAAQGLEWLVRGNQVLYVGAFNRENPWGDFTTRETWNYA